MTSMPKLDTAVVAGSAVAAADQIMQGIHDNREHKSGSSHYVKAAVATAIALGAMSLLRKDEHLDGDNRHHHHHGGHHSDEIELIGHHSHDDHHHHRDGNHHHHDGEGHTRDLVAEAVGAYALGRQMLGHNDWQIFKMVAEGLGAAAFAKEVDRDLIEE